MDSTVLNHLEVLGLEKFAAVFEENEIDAETFLCLTEENLRRLLPEKIGPQIKIKNYIQSLLKETSESNLDDSIEVLQVDSQEPSTSANIVCFICTEIFNTPQRMWKHLLHVHSINQNRHHFICTSCNSEFNFLRSFKRHIFNCPLVSTVIWNESTDLLLENISDDIYDETVIVNASTQYSPETHNAAKFLCALQSSGKIPLNVTQSFVDYTEKLVASTIESVLSIVHRHATSNELYEKVENEVKVNDLYHPFKGIETQFKLEKYLKSEGHLLKFREIILNENQILESRPSGSQKQTYDYIYFVSLKETLEKILEREELFKVIHTRQNTVPDEFFKSHFRDGQYYKAQLNDNFVINILVFNDDLEVCNPLGASKGVHKLNMTYFQILEFPSHWNSKLQNIYLISVTKTDNIKRYGHNAIQKILVTELIELWKDGFTVQTGHYNGVVRVKMAQVTGDNLSIQSTLGFSEVFVANKFCRWCEMGRTFTHTEVVENVEMLRTKNSFERHLALNDFSQTGIMFNSVFNLLGYYHVTDNKCPDIMHDICEGVALHDFRLLFRHLRSLDINIVTIQRLILSYKIPFGNSSKPVITENFINGGTAGITASQSLSLIYGLPLIFGHLLDKDDGYLELIVLLLEITQIVLSPLISVNGHYYLDNVIQRHHLLYKDLSGQTLKPKHHNLLHYPSAIVALGPLKQFWSMRFEAKHKLAKTIMHTSNNFCNVPKTVTKRMLLNLAKHLMSSEVPDIIIQKSYVCQIKSLLKSVVDCFVSLGFDVNAKVTCISKIEFKGSFLVIGDVLLDLYLETGPTFVKIVHMFIQNNNVCVIFMKLVTTGFNMRYYCYTVERTNTYMSKNLSDFKFNQPLTESVSLDNDDNNTYIMLPFKIV